MHAAGFEIFNGKLIEAGTPVFTSQNRGIRYGDGIFETLCVRNRQPLFFDDHFNRLEKGLKTLEIPFPGKFDKESLFESIQLLLLKNNYVHARIRLVLTREAEGLFKPAMSACSWHLAITGRVEEKYPDDPEGVSIDIYDQDVKSFGLLSPLKTLNCLVYVAAGLHASRTGFDEMLIKNDLGNIVEAISANVFFKTAQGYVTPPVSEGCLEGVMRKNLISLFIKKGVSIEEKPVHPDDLVNMDAILLTNVIKGVTPVSSFRGRKTDVRLASELNRWLNEYEPSKA